MSSFIIAGAILSILSGVAFCKSPIIDERTKNERTIDTAIKRICNQESLKNFIQCEVIPGVSQNGSFNPQAIRTEFGAYSGVIFATAKPSPLVVRPSDVRLVWRVTKAVRGSMGTHEEGIPIYDEIRVVIKFRFRESPPQDEDRLKTEKENLPSLNSFDVAPALYEAEDRFGRILTDLIIMERIDGVNLLEYIELSMNIERLKKYDEETRLRLPGLRLLYIHIESMLFLKRLQSKYKWRHCDLHNENVMLRRSTKDRLEELAHRLKENDQENDQMEETHREDWIALQFEARSIVIEKDNKKIHYQTDNRHFVLIDVEFATRVLVPLEDDPGYYVCHGISDISAIFINWKTEKAKVNKNPHLTRMRRALKGIFAPLAGRQLTASKEERKLKEVIGELKALEEEEKEAFITRLKGLKGRSGGTRRVFGEFLRQHLRRPQQGGTGSDRLSAASSKRIQAMRQRDARPLPQTGFLSAPRLTHKPHCL